MNRERYWIGLGSNLGDRPAMLRAAVTELGGRGLQVEAVSGLWETAPRDLEDQPAFLNGAVRVATGLRPPEVLALVKGVERDLGRASGGVRFGPRPIDCDLLAWSGGAWDADDLCVPHPRLTERRFAMLPLLELDPELTLPDGTRVADACAAIPAADQPVERWTGSGAA